MTFALQSCNIIIINQDKYRTSAVKLTAFRFRDVSPTPGAALIGDKEKDMNQKKLTLDRVAPQNIDAEQMLLGQMIMPNGDREVIDKVIQAGVIPEIFYKQYHQDIYIAIMNLYDNNHIVDEVSLVTELCKLIGDKNVDVGYIDDMVDMVPTSANCLYYANLVKEEALRRATIQKAVQLYESAFDPTTESEYLIKQFTEEIGAVADLYGHKNNGKYGHTAAEIEFMDLPDPEWIVKNYVPPGVTMVVGAPKMGKSWMTLNLAVGVAVKSGYFLGSVPIDNSGDVLYLALEDTFRRIKSRLKTTIISGSYPKNLTFWTDLPKLTAGGIAKIEHWIKTSPNPKMVVIDVFQKVRDVKLNKKSTAYEDDYEEIGIIKKLADKYNIAIILVHHTRKSDATDFVDKINGSTALAGACDGLLIIKRDRGQAEAVLCREGKDYDETDEVALKFDIDMGGWVLLGRADDYRITKQRQMIIDHLESCNEPMTPKQIAEATEQDHGYIKTTLRILLNEGIVQQWGYGKYVINQKR